MASPSVLAEFQKWWATEGHWVEEPNERRNGMSGVQRIEREGKTLYVKRMTEHLYRSILHPFGRPTIVREIQVIKELERAGVHVPKIVYGKALKIDGKWHALLVTEDMKGFICIADWYARHAVMPYPEAVRLEMLRQVANAFKGMHSINRQHGSCYVRHIYVRTEGEIAAGFLDLEKSRRRWTKNQAIQHDFKQLEKFLEPIPAADWQYVKDYYATL